MYSANESRICVNAIRHNYYNEVIIMHSHIENKLVYTSRQINVFVFNTKGIM